MSLRIPGKLIVQVRNGSRGAFAVGDLHTQVGSFKVKDPFLDQFAEGEYEGEFIVTQIFPHCYTYRGGITTEIRAKVIDYVLAMADEKPVSPEPEPDPIDHPVNEGAGQPAQDQCPPDRTQRKKGPPKQVESKAPAPAPTSDLFDEELASMIAAGSAIKLDPTIDRQKFRAQRDFLKAGGYRFNSSDQVWSLDERQ